MNELLDKVISAAQESYSAHIEEPWVNKPGSFTLKHPINRKIFAVFSVPSDNSACAAPAVMTVKVGENSAKELLANPGFVAPVHFTKKDWVGVKLDGSVAKDELLRLLQLSHEMVSPKSFASSPAVRNSMKGNTSKDTKPELKVRRMLREMGQTGYRLQWKKCPGRPDVAFPGRKKAIYVNGCFWHRHEGCKHATTPKTNVEYWQTKFENNVARDERNLKAAAQEGWDTLVIWECALEKEKIDATRDVIYEFLNL